MGTVVNLKRFKKRTEKEQSTKLAEVNRARFGRTKAERVQEKDRADRAKVALDHHHLSSEDGR